MRRTFALALAPICLVVALSACGSDKEKSPTTTVTGSTIGGQQSPGPGGNNGNGNADQNPAPSAEAPTATSAGGSTPDTQDKINDASPGMGSTP